MLDVIASELTEDLRKAFPNLDVKWQQFDPTVFIRIKGNNDVYIEMWLGAEEIGAAVWMEYRYIDMITSSYGDPEVFDRIQSFVSRHHYQLISAGPP